MKSKKRHQKVQMYLTILWAILIPISVLFLRNSVPWLVVMSAWANFAGHWSAFEAARD